VAACRLPVAVLALVNTFPSCRWEDEQEFDAITEVLLPKSVHLLQLEQAHVHIEQIRAVPWASAFTAGKVRLSRRRRRRRRLCPT
jgi:hypothetical protein